MGAYGHRYLIKKVLDHDSSSDVIPVAMNEKHPAEKLEPCYSIITGPHGLSSFFTHHAYTNMSFLDHATVISTIAYSQGYGLLTRRLD